MLFPYTTLDNDLRSHGVGIIPLCPSLETIHISGQKSVLFLLVNSKEYLLSPLSLNVSSKLACFR